MSLAAVLDAAAAPLLDDPGLAAAGPFVRCVHAALREFPGHDSRSQRAQCRGLRNFLGADEKWPN